MSLKEEYLVLDNTIVKRTGKEKLNLPKIRNAQEHYRFRLGDVLVTWLIGSIWSLIYSFLRLAVISVVWALVHTHNH